MYAQLYIHQLHIFIFIYKIRTKEVMDVCKRNSHEIFDR